MRSTQVMGLNISMRSTQAEHAVYASNAMNMRSTQAKHAVYASNEIDMRSTQAKHAVYASNSTQTKHAVYASNEINMRSTQAKHAVYASNEIGYKHAVYASNEIDHKHAVYANDGSDSSPTFSPKRRKLSYTTVEKVDKNEKFIEVVDCEDKEEDDWLPPPPKVSTDTLKLGEDSTIKDLRNRPVLLEPFGHRLTCVLALKSNSDWKQTGGNGVWKFRGNLKTVTSGKHFMQKNSKPFTGSLTRNLLMGEKSLNAMTADLDSNNKLVESVLSKVVEEFEHRIASQTELVFSDTQPLIRSVLDGYNVCIFANGQTGLRKTYTMSGPTDLTEQNQGKKKKNTISYDVSVQTIEIYNEQKNSHVPYRNNKLTQLLQDSLGGQAKTLMFVHISPELDAVGEIISTLKFAERVATIKLGAARVNKGGSPRYCYASSFLAHEGSHYV
ncbi:hypothetical protein ACSBR1_023785 [Camellia fascicularis]